MKSAPKSSPRSPPQKRKITKEERRAKYTQRARNKQLKVSRDVVCFSCRGRGHTVAQCPKQKESQKDKICYHCGSLEHGLFSCPKRKPNDRSMDNLPFATCFVCLQKGHLAGQCPNNQKGVYIHGGSCKRCGSKQHLVTKCPEKEKKKETDSSGEEQEDYSDLLQDQGDKTTKKGEADKNTADSKPKKRRVVKF